MPNEKDKNTVTKNDLKEILEDMYSYKQPREKEFQPTVIPIQNQTQAPPLQLLGQQSYNNSPFNYVPPSYEGLKELSLKRDRMATQNMSGFEKAKETVYNMGVNKGDLNYDAVQELINTSLNDYEKDLNAGDWGSHRGKIKDIVKDIMENKGGNTLLSIRQRQSERQEEVDKEVKEYNSSTLTGGVRTDKIPFYTTPIYEDISIVDGKVYGGGVRYNPIFKERNIPKELKDYMDGIKASSGPLQTEVNEDGSVSRVYYVPTNVDTQYASLAGKRVTEDQIKVAANEYLKGTGGDEYLMNEAKIKMFNNPATLDSIKQDLIALGNISEKDKNGENEFTKLSSLSDTELLNRLQNSKLGETIEYVKAKSSLLSGSVALNAFTEITSSAIQDDVALAAMTEQYKGRSSSDSGREDLTLDGFPTYVVGMGSPIQTIQQNNPEFISNLYNKQQSLVANIKSVYDRIEANKKNIPEYEKSNAAVSDSTSIREMEEELKIINEGIKNNYKQIGDVVFNSTKARSTSSTPVALTLNSLYTHYSNQAMFKDGKKTPIPIDQFSTVFSAAIAAEADDDSKTNAADILVKNGIGLLINFDGSTAKDINKTNFREFKHVKAGTGADAPPSRIETINTKSSAQYTNNGDLLQVVKVAGAYYKKNVKRQTELRTKILNGTATDKEVKEMEGAEKMYSQETQVLSRIIGATEKDTGGSLFNNTLDSLKDYFDFDTTMVLNAKGNPVSVATYLKEEYGAEPEDLLILFPKEKMEMGVSVTQNYSKINGNLLFVSSLNIDKDISKDKNPNAHRIKEKILREFPSGTLSLRSAVRNQKLAEESMYVALQAVYRENNSALSKLPESTKNALALSIANTTGISGKIDQLHLYTLPTNYEGGKPVTRQINAGNETLFISAIGEAGKKGSILHKDFRIQNSKGEYLVNLQDGSSTYMSLKDLNSPKGKGAVLKEFNTDLDIKAFFTRGLLDNQQESESNKKGGGREYKYGQDIPTNISGKTYSVNTKRNGKPFVLESYVPAENLVDITGKVNISSTAGIPLVDRRVSNNVIRFFNDFGLTMSGGMRGKNHSPANGEETSAHKSGLAIDVRYNEASKKVIKQLKDNPKLAEEYGIQFNLGHGEGSNYHLHVTFNPSYGNRKSPDKRNVSASRINIPFNTNTFISNIAQGESSNRNIGRHYTDASSSAFGKFGLTDYFLEKGANYMDVSVDTFKNNPKLVEKYLRGKYIKDAFEEINPIKNTLKTKYNLSDQDLLYAYHYVGGNKLKEIAQNKLSLDYVPSDLSHHNRLSVRQYIQNKNRI